MIAVFDSGVGGLSVLREIRAQLPRADLLYFADQFHVPYGARPIEEIRLFSEAITRFLLARGAATIVVACNTASAAALKHLRATFPDVPFVGMEPAVKPAVERSRARVVGVIATPATFQGELFASAVDRFATGVKVITQICPGLVEQIEAGELDRPKTKAILRESLAPLIAQGIDTLVLGCTHYPFVIPAMREIVGPVVEIIDPSPAVARQVERVSAHRLDLQRETGRLILVSTGDVDKLKEFADRVAGMKGKEAQGKWEGGNSVSLLSP
ncbi:MAG: glutamate racemase [Chloroflexi bacterium]|nr:glutamate racemase [Chloroflexota bacterium]